MSFLSSIFEKIFPPTHANTSSVNSSQPPVANTTQAAQPQTQNGVGDTVAPVKDPVDVANILDGKNQKLRSQLAWRTSIVDLLKLLELDSSLEARKSLANELDYTGDTNDSATMNIWLHKQVMGKLAANGGTVPAELKD